MESRITTFIPVHSKAENRFPVHIIKMCTRRTTTILKDSNSFEGFQLFWNSLPPQSLLVVRVYPCCSNFQQRATFLIERIKLNCSSGQTIHNGLPTTFIWTSWKLRKGARLTVNCIGIQITLMRCNTLFYILWEQK